jgi:hypothetical protein
MRRRQREERREKEGRREEKKRVGRGERRRGEKESWDLVREGERVGWRW